MAQLWKVRFPRSRVLGGLGQPAPDWMPGPTGFNFDYKPPRFSDNEIRAGVALGAGLLSAVGIVLLAKGKTKAAYTLGAAGAITGAFFNALRILREKD